MVGCGQTSMQSGNPVLSTQRQKARSPMLVWHIYDVLSHSNMPLAGEDLSGNESNSVCCRGTCTASRRRAITPSSRSCRRRTLPTRLICAPPSSSRCLRQGPLECTSATLDMSYRTLQLSNPSPSTCYSGSIQTPPAVLSLGQLQASLA